MAINIFSGGSSAKGSSNPSAPKASTAASRAAASTAAVGVPAGTSTSGNTAVQSGGIMGKVGGFLNKVSGLLAGIPGPVGSIAGIVNGLTSNNDPEWWNNVKGDGLTTNAPLQTVVEGKYTVFADAKPLATLRPAFLTFNSRGPVTVSATDISFSDNVVMEVDDRMTTQYLMPQIRKVTNAVALQDATAYRVALMVDSTIYALWRQLQKYDYILKHGQTFMPSIADGAFPIFMTTNAAYLQSLISRLEEYLRANVRLPHTLCEYLTWRYGRIFRANSSAKAPFVLYDYVNIGSSVASYDEAATNLMSDISSNALVQKANSDLYNAYLAHDQEVLLTDESQAVYDCKEFVLRTNLDLIQTYDSVFTGLTDTTIMMDSNLDNPTAFMASTVSCFVDDGTGTNRALFPVQDAGIWLYDTALSGSSNSLSFMLWTSSTSDQNATAIASRSSAPGSHWFSRQIKAYIPNATSVDVWTPLVTLTLAKAVDFYNIGVFLPLSKAAATNVTNTDLVGFVDVTALTIDSGTVSDLVLRNEQVFAFANLVNEDATSKTTYKQVEKRVASDVANFVEHTDVATLAPATPR